MPIDRLLLTESQRRSLWQQVATAIERFLTGVGDLRVAPLLDPDALRRRLEPFDFHDPMEPAEAVEFITGALDTDQVHTSHPRYFGLFNPPATTMGIAADALVAAYNPQLAAWSHSPLAVELELKLGRVFGARFGYDPDSVASTFTTGGAEANHTALLCALTHHFPGFATGGVRGLPGRPLLYLSAEAHDSFVKAARASGLGSESVRAVPSGEDLRMDPALLEAMIRADRDEGHLPTLLVATAGTTGGGMVDPLPELAGIAEREDMWFHVDAAWGGAAVLDPALRDVLAGIERADSITFDAHKWLAVPMGAGMFLTRHRDILSRTFRVAADYMPRDAAGLEVVDPFLHSMQWSRRFIGLKVFLSLAVAGWDGYARAIRHQTTVGDLLREVLRRHGWRVVNDTRLPVVCFVEPDTPDPAAFNAAVVAYVVHSGRAWISATDLGRAGSVLRACITNPRTGPDDIMALVKVVDEARAAVLSGRYPG